MVRRLCGSWAAFYWIYVFLGLCADKSIENGQKKQSQKNTIVFLTVFAYNNITKKWKGWKEYEGNKNDRV